MCEFPSIAMEFLAGDPYKQLLGCLGSRTRQGHIPTEKARQNWAWIGHMLAKPATDPTKQAFKWNPQGKRRWKGLLKPEESQLRKN